MRRPLLLLAPVLALHAALALLTQPGGGPVNDEGPLLAYAERLAAGGYAVRHTTDAVSYLWHGPGLPAALAPLVALGVPVEAMRLVVGPLPLFAAVLVFHRLLLVRFSPRTALAGAVAFGVYWPFLQPLRSIHKEPLALLVVAVAMLALARGLRDGRRGWLVASGVAWGALVMVRVEYGWVLLGMLAGCAAWAAFASDRAPVRRTAAALAVGLAACVPWLVYTYDVTGRALYWGNSGGISLFWMSPSAHNGLGEWRGLDEHVRAQPALAPYRPLFARLERLPPLERDLELQRLTVRNVRARPARYARNLAANGLRLWFLVPARNRPDAGTLALYAVSNALLLCAMAWAAATLARRRRRLPPETLPFAAFAVLGLLIHLPPSADPRMALPMVPAMLWLVVLAWSMRSLPGTAFAGIPPAPAKPVP